MIERTVVYHSPDGQTFDFTTYPSSLADIDGLYVPQTANSSQKAPFQDGSSYTGTTLQEREIPVTCGYVSSFDVSAIQAYRRNLQSVCNPKTNDRLGVGYLDVTEAGVLRRFYCVVDSVSMAPISRRKPGSDAIVTFLCHDPYAYSDTNASENVSSVLETFEFQFVFEPTIELGASRAGGVTITNAGDVDASVVITIDGPCSNPVVTNTTTGEYFKLNYILDGGEMATIDTGESTVYINGSSAIQYTDIGSTFFKLIPGGNTVAFSEDAGTSAATCIITWADPYIGL